MLATGSGDGAGLPILSASSVPGGSQLGQRLTSLMTGRDLADASLMEQVNSRYYRLRHTLSCCPPHPRTIKYDSESIGHGRNISRRRVGRIWNGSWKASATEDPLADLLRLRAWRGGRKRMLHHRADAARSQLPVAEAPRQRPPA